MGRCSTVGGECTVGGLGGDARSRRNIGGSRDGGSVLGGEGGSFELRLLLLLHGLPLLRRRWCASGVGGRCCTGGGRRLYRAAAVHVSMGSTRP